VVEDDRPCLTVIGDHDITTAGNGAQGLELVRHGPPPDLIITDIMMPEMDGLDMVKAIKADPATAAIPVIILSAKADQQAHEAGQDVGAVNYLTKPLTSTRLLGAIRASFQTSSGRR